MSREERRYSVPHGPNLPLPPAASEDLHAWSIYRQNLNSDFTDSALGSSDKSPLPYGNFQLRDTTVQSILNHPRYGPKSSLGSNMYTYLKFGLPRVFPPNHNRGSRQTGTAPNRGRVNRAFRDSSGHCAGSSGYDSSDNETTKSRTATNLRKYRSESDFRAMNTLVGSRPSSRAQGNIPLSALEEAHSRASIAGTHVNSHHYMQSGKHYGNRSHSEADILGGNDIFNDYDSRLNSNIRNRSDPHMLSNYQASNVGLVYPNIQVHNLEVNSKIRGINVEAKAGDLLAIMATSQTEGTDVAECLSGLKSRLSGDILVNGQIVDKRGLREICAYVPALYKSSLDPRMSVQSTLNFHAILRGPLNISSLKEKINILIEDLGLTNVRAANVSRLTYSEKQRLNVACQLLSQSPIIVLDQVTSNMDIFDTFFLVEYLRQWCSVGRIVIMTLQPPTFEILSMCSRILLLSCGKTIFSGNRSDLPRHMGSLGYPCPPFKNPADYYLDLVTLDDLSAAAMLESSARIEILANAWDRVKSDQPLPVPPAALSTYTIRAGFFKQTKALIKRFVFYKQPGSLFSWIKKLIIAAILSLCIGSVFWDIPSSDPQLNLNDRLGYHHCIMAVAYWPLIMMDMRDAFKDRCHAERGVNLGLYSKRLYVTVQWFCGLLPSLCIWLAFLLPAHSMTSLYSNTNRGDTGIYLYIGYMLLFLTAIRSISLFFVNLLPTKTSATVLTTIFLFTLAAITGYSVHPRNLPKYWMWPQIFTPGRWLLPVITADEYSQTTLANTARLQLCRNKQVQHQEIIVQQACPPPNGTQILEDFLLLPENHVLVSDNIEETTAIALIIVSVVFFIITFLTYSFCVRKINKKQKEF